MSGGRFDEIAITIQPQDRTRREAFERDVSECLGQTGSIERPKSAVGWGRRLPAFSQRKHDRNQQRNGERDAKQFHRSGLILHLSSLTRIRAFHWLAR